MSTNDTNYTLRRFQTTRQVIDNLFHIWSLSRLCLQTAFHDLLKPARLHTRCLRLALLGIWQFPDTHLTEKNSKTVDIDLMTTHFIDYGSTTM